MERLSHFFESAAKINDLPQTYKAARFTSPGSQLVIEHVQWVEPKDGEVVVKVSSCGLHSTDHIAKHGLLSHLKYPITPGSLCTGEIVQIGNNVKGGFKLSHKVIGVASHGCLAEYVVLNADYVAELKRKEGPTQQSYAEVFEAGRVQAEFTRFEHEEKELSKDQRRRVQDANERLGYHDSGIIVVIGEGGSARVATQVLKNAFSPSSILHKEGQQRVLVVTPDDKWNHTFYDVEEGNHLKFTHNEIGSCLKEIGGIRFAVAVNQPPQQGFEQILEAMRYNSELVFLSPHHQHKLEVPLAPVVAKALSLRGAVWPDRLSLEKVLEMVHTHSVHVSANLYKFNQEGIEKAWMDLEDGKKFDQPVVVVCETIQATELH